jgi:hypothetical protein
MDSNNNINWTKRDLSVKVMKQKKQMNTQELNK